MNIRIYRRTKETQPKRNPYNFMPAVPFGGEKKGRAGALCQRSARKGRAGIFEKHTFLSIQNCCAPLTRRESSPKLRTPKGSAEKLRKRDILLGFCMGIYGFYQGKVRAEFLAKEFSAWYNGSANKPRGFISRRTESFLTEGISISGSSRAQEIAPSVF